MKIFPVPVYFTPMRGERNKERWRERETKRDGEREK